LGEWFRSALGKAAQDVDERLLGGVGRIVLGAEDAKAEVEDAALVALVEGGERVPVAGGGALSQRPLVGVVGDRESRHSRHPYLLPSGFESARRPAGRPLPSPFQPGSA
jgi:hypothetical protein